MRKRRVKFIWGASHVIRGRWHGGLFGWYERVPGDVHSGLAISIRGALAWGALLAVLLYIVAAAGLYAVWRGNPYNQLTYGDAVLYPLRRADVADKKGRAFIAQGSALFKEGKYADAANYLRLGLARHPADLNARLQLAQFYVLANQRPLALKVLTEGLGVAYPGKGYLETLFHAWDQGEQHADIAETARRYLPRVRAASADTDRRWLEERACAALLASGNAQDALALAQAMPSGNASWEHRVIALLALNQPEDALMALDEWRSSPGADSGAVVRLRARALREAGQLDGMERTLSDLAGLHPADPGALVYGVVQRTLAGRAADAESALANYVFRFGGSVENLLLVAEPLAQLNNRALLQQCVRAAEERGFPLARFHALLAQVHVAQGDWPRARASLEDFARGDAQAAPANRAWGEWMRRLVAVADSPAESGHLALLEFLRARSWPMRMFRASVETLRRAQRPAAAREVVAIGLRGYPQNAWLLAQAEELKSAAAAAARIAEVTPAPVHAEADFFTQLEEMTDSAQWDVAEKMIRDLRAVRPSPAWLDRREAELWLVQGRCRQARGDLPGLATAARMYLGGKEEHASRLLEVARGFDQRADRAAALTVTREVLRRFPAFAAAQKQLAEWEPSRSPEQTPGR